MCIIRLACAGMFVTNSADYIKDWYCARNDCCSDVQPFCSRIVEIDRQMIGEGTICEFSIQADSTHLALFHQVVEELQPALRIRRNQAASHVQK